MRNEKELLVRGLINSLKKRIRSNHDRLEITAFFRGSIFYDYLKLAQTLSEMPEPPAEGASVREKIGYRWSWASFKSISDSIEDGLEYVYSMNLTTGYTHPDAPVIFIDKKLTKWLEETGCIDTDISNLNETVENATKQMYHALKMVEDIIQFMINKSNEALSHVKPRDFEGALESGYAEYKRENYHDLQITLKKDAGRKKQRANERLNDEHWARLVEADKKLVREAINGMLTEDKEQVLYTDDYCRQMEREPALLSLVNDQFDTEDLFDFHHAIRLQQLIDKITPFNLDFFFDRVLRSDIIKAEMFPDLKERLIATPPPATDEPQHTPTQKELTDQAVQNALRLMAKKMKTEEMKELPKAAVWQGIYRVLADRKIVKEGEYLAFGQYINSLNVEGMTITDNGKGVCKTNNDGIFGKPLSEWDIMKYKGKKKAVYDRYYLAATTFNDTLTACLQQLKIKPPK